MGCLAVSNSHVHASLSASAVFPHAFNSSERICKVGYQLNKPVVRVKDTTLSRLTFLGLPTLALRRIKHSDHFHQGIRFSGKASHQGFLHSAVSVGVGRMRNSHDVCKSRCQNPNHTSLSQLPKALFTKVEVLAKTLVKSSAGHSAFHLLKCP